MADPDYSGLFFGEEDTDGRARAAALAQALGRQRQMGMLGQLSGDKVLAGVGGGLLEDAGRQEAGLQAAGGQRLRAKMDADKAKREAAAQAALEAHQTTQDKQGWARLAQDNYTFNPANAYGPGVKLNRKTGAMELLPGSGTDGGMGRKDAEDLDKFLEHLGNDLDPSRGRNGLFGQDQGLVTAADKVLALTHNPDGSRNYKLTVRQVPEMVQAVASMLSNGGHAAMAQLHHLMPQTASMSLAEKVEYLAGHPENAGVEEFVKQYAETAERERDLARDRIRGVQLDRMAKHQGGYSRFPEQGRAAARQYLKDLDDDSIGQAFVGKYDRNAKKAHGEAPGTGGSGSAWTDAKAKRKAELLAKKAAGTIQ